MSVGVMEDYKLRDLRVSHTLGWSWNWNTLKIKTRLTNEKFASVKGECLHIGKLDFSFLFFPPSGQSVNWQANRMNIERSQVPSTSA
jgi:hypothetical protein